MSHVYGPSHHRSQQFVSLKPKNTFEKRSVSPRPAPLYRKDIRDTKNNNDTKAGTKETQHLSTASLHNPYTSEVSKY